MIEVVNTTETGVQLRVTVRRLAIYLDNWAIIRLAKDPGALRDRFVQSLKDGADVLFSVTNASEIVGPEGASRAAVRDLFTAIGPYWVPVEGPGIVDVMKREEHGAGRDACISHDIAQKYFAGKNILVHGEQRLDYVPPEFFDLGFFLDWLIPQRDSIRKTMSNFDVVLAQKFRALRTAYDNNKANFGRVLPVPKFDAARPATFCWQALLRMLILNGKAYTWKSGDSADFCHALLAASYAQVATLDKQWKQRIELLPKPNSLARVYYEPEMEQFLADVESSVANSPYLRHPVAAAANGLQP